MKNFEPLIQKFIRHKSIEIGFSTKSLEAYRSDLSAFILQISQQKSTIDRINIGTLEDYIGSLFDKGYKAGSIARKISVLKQFFKFLYLEKVILTNPAKDIKQPKKDHILPSPLSTDEIDLLINTARAGSFPHNVRFVAMLEIIYGSGLRVSELVSLPVSVATQNKDYAVISGKGKKQRLIPFTDRSRMAMLDYLPFRLSFCGGMDSAFLFPSTGRDGHLTRVRFFQILKTIGAQAGIDDKKLKPHNFRHSFATHLLKGGADLKSVQNLLGHAHISTTEIYTHLDKDDVKKALYETHPMYK